jgi:DNA-directed RNA polymerase sigma subunit (sigma70/sigma32)
MKAANDIKLNTNLNVNMSYEEIAEKLNLTVKEVKEAEASALRKLRHPRVGKEFKKYLGI